MNKNRELIAILRGLTRDRCVVVSEILIAEGFSKLEVPLNSPNPMETIAEMQKRFGTSVINISPTVTHLSSVSPLKIAINSRFLFIVFTYQDMLV